MTFVVIESCIKCKLMDCVEVCPVDCFHEGPNMLVIDPDECIDCTLCEPECPVDAIVADDEIPEGQENFLQLIKRLSHRARTGIRTKVSSFALSRSAMKLQAGKLVIRGSKPCQRRDLFI